MLSRILFLSLLLSSLSISAQSDYYFPARGVQWETRSPESLGFEPEKLEAAVAYAQANEYSGPRDLRQAILKGFEYEPFHQILGPTKKRGGPAGMILRNGYLVAKWGETERVDMTF
ncbi:MAG: serine hydrolase, partial [Bacteroidota bacterium]